jgi:hypothetical protein
MPNDGGVWVKMGDAAPPGVAVIGTGSVGVDNNPNGKPSSATDNADGSYDYVDGDKTYRVYAFTTPTTRASIRLTDEARARITDEDLLMAVATTELPDEFTGDPVKLFDRKYSKQLRNALEITPAVDPDLKLDVEKAGFVDLLVIGGGGAGAEAEGAGGGGGGGAGGVLYATECYVSAGSHSVTVGDGGMVFPHQSSSTVVGDNGKSSSIGQFYAPGGGAGGGLTRSTSGTRFTTRGLSGASGGGGGGGITGVAAAGGSGATGIGNAGGNGTINASSPYGGAGGGGGVGSVGSNGSTGVGGAGGAGVSNSITGSAVTYGGGGGGCGYGTPGAGGSGGGGTGGNSLTDVSGTSGTANTGGGGGGGESDIGAGDGGSGIVIVRVEI